MSEGKDLIIRNSTAEFLIFEKQAHADSIEVRYEDETLWLTQKMMSNLFDVESNTITYHLQEIFRSGELDKESTTRKFRVVQTEGTRQVSREVDHYNLDAVISVGYRVNSIRATQFRRWATQVLKQYAITGYVIDRKRMEEQRANVMKALLRMNELEITDFTKEELERISYIVDCRNKVHIRLSKEKEIFSESFDLPIYNEAIIFLKKLCEQINKNGTRIYHTCDFVIE